jgi:hypothetical protein
MHACDSCIVITKCCGVAKGVMQIFIHPPIQCTKKEKENKKGRGK